MQGLQTIYQVVFMQFIYRLSTYYTQEVNLVYLLLSKGCLCVIMFELLITLSTSQYGFNLRNQKNSGNRLALDA